MSNYNYFYKETQRNLSQQEPQIAFKDFPQKISKMWKELPVDQKKKFNEMQMADKVRYAEEVKQTQDSLKSLKSLVKSEQIYKNIKNIKSNVKMEEEKATPIVKTD